MSLRYVEFWLADGRLQRESDDPLPAYAAHVDAAWIAGLAHATVPAPTAGQVWSGDPANPGYVTPLASPAPSQTVSATSFVKDRLTLPVLIAAMQRAAQPDFTLQAFMLLVQVTDPVTLTDPATITGVGYLRSIGLITDADIARILAPVT